MSMTLTTEKEGDISSAFVSLSGSPPVPLPPRFADIKRLLIAGREEDVKASWNRLLRVLKDEIEEIKTNGSSCIPEINFSDIDNPSAEFIRRHRKCGVAIVRNVVTESKALEWEQDLKDYIQKNRALTKGFPSEKPAIFEIYWSRAQVLARAHPNLRKTQRFFLSQWHSGDPEALISTANPVTYVDRLRIRPPGDEGFALGPHVDGGSCERWEPEGYGRGGVYDSVFQGRWEEYDAFEASCRIPAVSDIYNGKGACSIFRAYQGWLSMSYTQPGEGTLLVNPLFSRATAYYLLRPFFSPKTMDLVGPAFLDADNWQLDLEPSSLLQGASPGKGQELSVELHPHLELDKTMVYIPAVQPGDYIAWHCDTVHAVDKVHRGSRDSSVLYIPTCPLTEHNAHYLVREREAFKQGEPLWLKVRAYERYMLTDRGLPGVDFPTGKGESEHTGRPTLELLGDILASNDDGMRAMGLKAWATDRVSANGGQTRMISRANEILGFT